MKLKQISEPTEKHFSELYNASLMCRLYYANEQRKLLCDYQKAALFMDEESGKVIGWKKINSE